MDRTNVFRALLYVMGAHNDRLRAAVTGFAHCSGY